MNFVYYVVIDHHDVSHRISIRVHQVVICTFGQNESVAFFLP